MYWKDGVTNNGQQIYKYFAFEPDLSKLEIIFVIKIVAADTEADFLEYYELNK